MKLPSSQFDQGVGTLREETMYATSVMYDITVLGKTPVFDLMVEVNCTILAKDKPLGGIKLDAEGAFHRDIALDETIPRTCAAVVPSSDVHSYYFVQVFGNVSYRDYFNVKHETVFCFNGDKARATADKGSLLGLEDCAPTIGNLFRNM